MTSRPAYQLEGESGRTDGPGWAGRSKTKLFQPLNVSLFQQVSGWVCGRGTWLRLGGQVLYIWHVHVVEGGEIIQEQDGKGRGW